MFKLPSELTVHQAGELKEKLLNFVESNGQEEKNELYFDGSQVEDVDAAGVQLLLSSYLTGQEAGKTIKLYEPSQTLERMLRLSGVLDYF